MPDVVATLRAAGCVFAEDEARLLASSASTPGELATMVERRVAGLPLEQILGWAEFCGLRIAVWPTVFVPRRRSEFLARQAAGLIGSGAVVVDLCCGSGALGAFLAASVEGVRLHAADIDAAAVRCARRNVPEGAHVYEGDLYEPLPVALHGRVDVLVVNAPYVPTGEIAMMPREARDYEAPVALDGGGDGLDVQRRVAAGASRWLAPGGRLLIETGERQAPRTVEALARSGLTSRVVACEDLAATVVIASMPARDGRS